MQGDIAANLAAVRKRIAEAAAHAGRAPSDVEIVAVTKTHAAETVRRAISAGMAVFGENKVQEAEAKITDIGHENITWHMIGHLQSNKARRAVQLFDVIQSVDSLELAERLERICNEEGRGELPIFVQIDLAREHTKNGIPEADLAGLTAYLETCRHLRFDGLMAIPPFFDDPERTRPFFARLRAIRDELQKQGAFGNRIGKLSMGMSHDLEIAVEEGATAVRIGTDIFGERNSQV